MNPRLVILVVAGAGLAIYLATRTTRPPGEGPQVEEVLDGQDLREIRLLQTLLANRPLPGREPPEPPGLSIQVEVDPAETKHRLYYYITEAHGYYVETFKISFYYKPDPGTSIEESPQVVPTYLDDYVKADETLKGCIEIVPAELASIGGDMGTSKEWDAVITSHGRARMQNPDPLPPLTEVGKCR